MLVAPEGYRVARTALKGGSRLHGLDSHGGRAALALGPQLLCSLARGNQLVALLRSNPQAHTISTSPCRT